MQPHVPPEPAAQSLGGAGHTRGTCEASKVGDSFPFLVDAIGTARGGHRGTAPVACTKAYYGTVECLRRGRPPPSSPRVLHLPSNPLPFTYEYQPTMQGSSSPASSRVTDPLPITSAFARGLESLSALATC